MLPIEPVLPTLIDALSARGATVLVSPPGTGKTTLVPLALAGLRVGGERAGVGGERPGGRVVVAEPRRVAARAAASRMAFLLGEKVGQRVGYTVRGERRVSSSTSVEVVTTGVLVRRLLRDPELPGVGTVIIDECHERHLDTDLALAFGLETRSVLRPDLALLAMSATADASRLASLMGGAPVIGADAPLFDVAVLYRPPLARTDPPRGLWVDPRFLDHVASVTRSAFSDTDGDVLVFLPGAGEIEAVARRLPFPVARLHGRMSPRDQDAVLRPSSDGRRVVLSSAVGESSLTVPGVRVVVDAGLARVPRLDLARGLGALTTVRVSRSVAHQRAGRAGREAPGRVYRCWSEAEHDRLPAQPEPEIATADLTSFALSLAEWGDPSGGDLALLDPPPVSAMTVARQALHDLAAVDGGGRITDRGRRIASAGVHPRLGRALLDGADLVGARRAAEVVAILAEDAVAGDDLAAVWRRLRAGGDAASARWREEARRLRDGAAGSGGGRVNDDLAAAMVVGLAFPERLARLRPGAGGYLMAGGTAADLAPGSGLAGSAWLAIATAARQPGSPSATVRLAAAVDEGSAREIGATLLSSGDEVAWVDGGVVARSVERLGAIVLRERVIADPPAEAVAGALRNGLDRVGLGLLTWTPEATRLRDRLAFCRSALGAEWPDVSDEALLSTVDTWLGPDLHKARRRADLARIAVPQALRRLLDFRQAASLDDVAPERLEVPSGSRVRLDYAEGVPVLAVKLQEAFGWTSSPRVGKGRVPVKVHLLSPAGRPLAVTSDLESFWRNGYPGVRAEMRGRYPRHPWPEDPLAAAPTRRLNPRRS